MDNKISKIKRYGTNKLKNNTILILLILSGISSDLLLRAMTTGKGEI